MSASSAARISSRLTSGSVCETGIRPPSGSRPAASVPGVELGDHVLQAGLGPQQDRGVAVDAVVARLDLHADDRAAVLELDALDLADLDARDVHRLALARRDGLGGLHLRLDLVEVLADHRHPARQRQALVGQDHRRDEARDQDQADDRREVLEVLADRGHRVELGWAVGLVGAVLAAAGPLTFGSLLVWQGTSGRYGGRLPG